MTKITADHLGRGAFVYIRQSTADQILHNPESRPRQYGLPARARQLGCTPVAVIDDQRVQGALKVVFAKFAERQSVRQGHVWLRDDGIALPVASHSAAEGHSIIWRLPLYNTVHNILTNPVYAGAYAFGRTVSKVSVENGRKRVKRGLRRPMAEWDVLLKDQHDGYI